METGGDDPPNIIKPAEGRFSHFSPVRVRRRPRRPGPRRGVRSRRRARIHRMLWQGRGAFSPAQRNRESVFSRPSVRLVPRAAVQRRREMHLGDLRYNIGMQDGIDELRNAFGFMGFFATVFRIVAGDILNDESRAEREGRIGEEWVRDTLERLDREQFAVMRNVILPFGGGTTEIDAVVFSRFGIFVIEVKTWSGWVFGQKGDKIWTVVYSGKRKKEIRKPAAPESRAREGVGGGHGASTGRFPFGCGFSGRMRIQDIDAGKRHSSGGA